jgi:hypothetical protein
MKEEKIVRKRQGKDLDRTMQRRCGFIPAAEMVLATPNSGNHIPSFNPSCYMATGVPRVVRTLSKCL